MRALLTGAGGQLGREIALACPDDVELRALDRAALDICDPSAVDRVIAATRPDVILNAAAYTAVDRAEREPDAAIATNARGVANLARAAAGTTRLLHVSTDFVFRGDAHRPYPTSATPDPTSVYGRSKLEGEKLVIGDGAPRGIVIRTAWLYSRFGHNFVKTMLRRMADQDAITIVADQIGSPTWARGLARAIWRAVERPDLEGVLHWTDAGVATWYDFAIAIHDEAHQLGLLDRPCAIRPIATSDYPTAARRPPFSVLDLSTTTRSLDLEPIHWRRQLRTMLQELAEHEES